MPIKILPQIGDFNWGKTLNNYIAQTTDNAKDGALHQFNDISKWPTGLTADDQGKTFLNFSSGNFYE